MKTITIDLYTYNELSPIAKEKALREWSVGEPTFLTDDLREYIYEELNAQEYSALGVATSKKPTIVPLYSLSHSQGDGLMFEADVEDKKGNVYTIKHYGHYYHERSASISGVDKDGEDIDTKNFEENVYIPICKKVAQRGYDEIEYAQSEEAFIDACECNDYTFEVDGTMRND